MLQSVAVLVGGVFYVGVANCGDTAGDVKKRRRMY